MFINRRTLLVGLSCSAFVPAAADDAFSDLKAYENESGGRIGVYAKNAASGKKLAWRADERFVMCSTFKASLAAFVLARVDRGLDHLDDTISYGADDLQDYAPVAKQNAAQGSMSIGQMCQAAVELSDNTCANLLMTHVGGPAALTEFWRSIEDDISRLDHYEPELNWSRPGDPHDTTTPAAMARNIEKLVTTETLSASSRDQLTNWMLNCKTGANRLRGGIAQGWRVADKTGSNGKDAVSDVAVVWPTSAAPIVIAAYTQGGSPTPAQQAAIFAKIGQMVSASLA